MLSHNDQYKRQLPSKLTKQSQVHFLPINSSVLLSLSLFPVCFDPLVCQVSVPNSLWIT